MPTIHKHFAEYQKESPYLAQAEQVKAMRDKVLAKVFQFAISGNVKAARVFLEATGGNRFSTCSAEAAD